MPGVVMDLTNIVNTKGGVAHFTDHHQMSFVKPERSASPHGSEHSHYSNHHVMSRAFPSPAAMQAPMHIQNPMQTSLSMSTFPDMSGMGGVPNMGMHQMPQQPPAQHPVKAYPCSTCGKGFARKSDLARHERIHSGDRPHVCEYQGCGKMFIQRSALTVHARVHTGEKPHHCETCAKRFSDSSSLARHRRTHFGTRPYKCPYADCQKTFTRRTTLTRHQNQHQGTVEEAAAATQAALAAAKHKGFEARSSDHVSNGSPMTTPSPANRTMSMSPSVDLSQTNGMGRHSGDFYMQQNGPLPPHMRVASPAPQNTAGYTGIRPTSHPTSYGPPPTLEPNLEQQHQSTPTSSGGSPHMASVGWQSPAHMASPSQNSYMYSDPSNQYQPEQNMPQMYYAAAPHMRRHQGDAGLVHMA